MMPDLEKLISTGFEDDLVEIASRDLNISGTLPSWLTGRLIRNGPAQYHAGDRELNHWFDGFAKLHKFAFSNGHITYSCKFLQSQAYATASKTGKLGMYEFASSPELHGMDKLKAVLDPPLTDNTNVNVIHCAGAWLAMTETKHVLEFDADSLATRGRFRFDDKLPGQISTAHPVIDPVTGDVYNFHVQLSASNHYVFSKLTRGSRSRKVVARFSVGQPAYVHSFSQTPKFLLLIDQPFLLNPMDLIFAKKPYVDCYRWHSGRGLQIHAIEKTSGDRTTFEFDDRYFFHQVNAFEQGTTLVLDMITYKDAQIVDALRLANLRAGGSVPLPTLERFRIDTTSKRVTAEKISDANFELPFIDYQRHSCQPYQFAYGASSSDDKHFLDGIVKVDVTNGTQKRYSRAGCFYGEPVFVARSRGMDEDAGVVLCVELNAPERKCSLVVIDAHSMSEVARAEVPNLIPFGFHGIFTQTGESQ